MMSRTTKAWLVVMAMSCVPAVAQPSAIRVYVTATSRGEFVEPETAAAVKDLQAELREKRRIFSVVATEVEAEMVVRVVTRGEVTNWSGVAAVPLYGGGAIAGEVSTRRKMLRAEMVVGTYRQDVSRVASHGWFGARRNAAKQVVLALEDWVATNGEALRRRRIGVD